VYAVVPSVGIIAVAVLPHAADPSSTTTLSAVLVAVAANDIVAVVLPVTAVMVAPAGIWPPITVSPTSPGVKLPSGSVRVVDPFVIPPSVIVRAIGSTGLIVMIAFAEVADAGADRVTVVPLIPVIVVPAGIPAP
jgi:hypothetical protein